jgi:hypothetical protein
MTKHRKKRRDMTGGKSKETIRQPPEGAEAYDVAVHNGVASPQRRVSGKTILAALAVVTMLAIVYGLATQTTSSSIIPSASAAGDSPGNTAKVEGGYQVIHMNVTAYGWEPNRFVLKKGVPVKWVIDGQQITGCNSGIKVPSLGLSFQNKKGIQTIEFTPTEAGTIPWSCLMGMIQGTFIVKDNIDTTDPAQVKSALDAAPAIPKSSGGCGCGM